MDYSRAKKKHPKLKVGNAKRLIKAIRDAEPLELARAKAELNPLKIGRRRAVCRDAQIDSVDDIGKKIGKKVPLVFDMANWMRASPVSELFGRGHLSIDALRTTPTCGTAACIAGFAGALMPKSAKANSMVWTALHRDDSYGWEGVLAEFLGIDEETASEMTSVMLTGIYNEDVRPRHAVRLLEIFLKTGNVDWMTAMGVKENPNPTRCTPIPTAAEERARRREDRVLEAAEAALAA